jgi:hypothetical protein
MEKIYKHGTENHVNELTCQDDYLPEILLGQVFSPISPPRMINAIGL